MNSKQLWNSHQRHKLLWAKASRDILKIRVLEMAFPRGVFHLGHHVVSSEYTQAWKECHPRHSKTLHSSNVSQARV